VGRGGEEGADFNPQVLVGGGEDAFADELPPFGAWAQAQALEVPAQARARLPSPPEGQRPKCSKYQRSARGRRRRCWEYQRRRVLEFLASLLGEPEAQVL
jgi:hypothetical protein